MTPPHPAEPNRLGLVLTGGGARAAYQVGVLRAMAQRFPDLDFDVLTGVSAGAINVAHLGGHPAAFDTAIEELAELWLSLRPDEVFDVDAPSLLWKILQFNLRMLLGGFRGAPEVRGSLDTRPLRKFLEGALAPDQNGRLAGIERKLDSGRLDAIALTTIEYNTSQTVTWVEGRGVDHWERTHRLSRECHLSLEHVMASAALPLIFPAIELEGSYHGDGGIRLSAPLSPAIHLGATRILAVSTRYRRPPGPRTEVDVIGYPPPAQIAGVLLNAIFLDNLDQDVSRAERLNLLLANEARGKLRPLDLVVVRPSEDLGRLAGEFEAQLPSLFHFVVRGFGSSKTKSPDVLSMLMFQRNYVQRLIEIGEHDAEARMTDLVRLVESG